MTASQKYAGGVLGLALIVGVALVLAAGDGGGEDGSADSSVAKIQDVHGLGVNPADGAVYIATHSGLFRAAEDESAAQRVDGPEQDLMGFSIAGPDRFFASGHPGPGQDLPANLGLIESGDRGETWRSVSLEGEADLHLLRATGETIYAFDGRLRVSSDGGRNWQERSAPGQLVDLAPNPANPDVVLASTNDGLQISRDAGRTWSKSELEQPVLLAWGGSDSTFAIDGDGRAYESNDGGQSWKASGQADLPPAAFTADDSGSLYVAGQDGSVDISSDDGRTWQARSRN